MFYNSIIILFIILRVIKKKLVNMWEIKIFKPFKNFVYKNFITFFIWYLLHTHAYIFYYLLFFLISNRGMF